MDTRSQSIHSGQADRPYPRNTDEFPPGASEWPSDLSRRRFLQLMGASLLMASVSSCNRPPSKEIVPYVAPPEAGFGPDALYYSSAFSWQGFGRGILVEAHSGRPTKIEGNPAHPDSLGATDAFTQASVLELYDPLRSKMALRNNNPVGANAYRDAWLIQHRRLLERKGAGLVIVTEPTTSPSLLREIYRVLDTFPQARWYQHTPLARWDRAGSQLDFDFAKADVVFALESDPLLSHPASLRYSRAFATRRRLESGKANLNRLYSAEATLSITGSMADLRLPLTPTRRAKLLNAIARQLEGHQTDTTLRPEEKAFVEKLAADLKAHAPNVICSVGPDMPEELHTWAEQINARLGAYGATIRRLPAARSDSDSRAAGTLADLGQAIDSGAVDTIFLVETNPAYTAPADLAFAQRLSKVPHRVHFGLYRDETASLCEWHVPASHYLESWSDLRAYDGTASIVQPLIEPMYTTVSPVSFVHSIADPAGRNDYELVRETWSTQRPGAAFDQQWRTWLDHGYIDGTTGAATTDAPSANAVAAIPETPDSATLTIVITPDPSVLDGRWFNNPWLQELPRPFTRLVWDNVALVAPSFAAAHQLTDGDLILLRAGKGTIEAPIWRLPGIAPDTIALTLGYGRIVDDDDGPKVHGYDAYALTTAAASRQMPATDFRKLGRGYQLVSTQGHFSMERRDLARSLEISDLEAFEPESKKRDTLYPEWKYKDYAWAMAIDLSTCIGCNACVVACQAENNIPVVGKDQVARGREMHWLRIDRYFEGEESNPRVMNQPVPCMHCENAPCELVCPVGATVHSSEGLNDMIYNRCVGTRYCSNNCPYKVRRFNFLDYRPTDGSPVYLQNNPDVTVRSRGVMEKCTYCVQRINSGRIAAEKANRRVRDGEIKTACQQVCPVEAIVFGDLSDRASRVNQRKNEKTNYALLAELNTLPRTTYLTRLLNTGTSQKKEPVA